MKNTLRNLVFLILGICLFLSRSTSIVSSSPMSGDIPMPVEGSPRFDHLAYLPLVIHDVNPIPNGNFELGRVNWSEFSGQSGNALILNSGFPGEVTPHSGSWAAWLGHAWWYFPQDDYIYQTITIPPEKPILHFWYWISSTEPNLYEDTFRVYFYDGSPHIDWGLNTTRNTLGWVEQTINLTGYAGITSMLQFASHNSWNDGSHIFLDDISLQED